MKNRGSSLVELLLYTGLLTTILVVLYQLFALAGYRKLNEVVQDEIYSNASHTLSDLARTVQHASIIDEPVSGASSVRLSLDGGAVVYELDGENRLIKTENGTTALLTSSAVLFNTITFVNRGPSVDSPTIGVDFDLAGTREVEGRAVSEQFTTSVTVR